MCRDALDRAQVAFATLELFPVLCCGAAIGRRAPRPRGADQGISVARLLLGELGGPPHLD